MKEGMARVLFHFAQKDRALVSRAISLRTDRRWRRRNRNLLEWTTERLLPLALLMGLILYLAIQMWLRE